MAPPKRPTRKPAATAGAALPSALHSDTSAIVESIIKDATSHTPETVGTVTTTGRVGEVSWAPLDHFAHRPDNPRWEREYDPETDPELAAFIETLDTYGVLQAVSVTSREAWLEHHPNDKVKLADDTVRWVVVMGNRRLAGARCKGLDGLPYHRNDNLAQPGMSREAPIIENYHRKPFDPIREAAEMVAILEETGQSRRSLAERLRISHAQINQRIQLLDLIQEFQGMVSDLLLPVYKALRIAALAPDQQRALLELGPPFVPARLVSSNDKPNGKTPSTASAVTIRRNSTPSQVADTLRKKLNSELLEAVVKLLRDDLEPA